MDDFSHTLHLRRGFTLAEMAIVVVLAGIIMTMGLKMTVASLNNAANSDTVNKQAQIKLALINYLRTNGTLPCPDQNLIPKGQPSPCNANFGVLPWLTLQLSRDTAVDGWGNFFTYQIANGLTAGTRNWNSTKVVGLNIPFDIGEYYDSSPALTINQGDGINPLQLVTAKAVVVILSAGKNGYGANTLQGIINAAPPGANKDEITNAKPATTTFIKRPYTENPASLGGAFDDVLAYMTPQDLLQPLVSEQTIAACKAYCTTPCSGPNAPSLYCTGSNLPATSATATSCTGPNTPYPGCTGPYKPTMCLVPAATSVPIGNPTPNCP